jgi:hypothetical protein
VAAALLLGGYLLFCHGCHGDEDNELFARGPSPAAGVPRPSAGRPFGRTPFLDTRAP